MPLRTGNKTALIKGKPLWKLFEWGASSLPGLGVPKGCHQAFLRVNFTDITDTNNTKSFVLSTSCPRNLIPFKENSHPCRVVTPKKESDRGPMNPMWDLMTFFFYMKKVLSGCSHGCNIKLYKEAEELDPEFPGQLSEK